MPWILEAGYLYAEVKDKLWLRNNEIIEKTTDACAIESGNFNDTAVRASWKLVCDVLTLPLLHSASCVNYLVDSDMYKLE